MKLLVSILTLLLVPVLAFAQFGAEDISVGVSPELPQPGQTVTLDVESFVTDLDRSRITWTLDSQVIAEGIGEQEASFVAGVVGTRHQVRVTVQTSDNGIITKTITIAPASVDLIWEAIDSYTPALYKGKSLNAHDSGVIVQALPFFVDAQGEQINPKALIYNWRVNNKPQQSASGFGKDTFSFPGPSLYRDAQVTVLAESPDGTYRANRVINLSAQAPKILFYAQDPLFGQRLINPVAGGTLNLEDDELVIRAEPYFFSDVSSVSQVDYEWKIDGRDIITVGDRNIITLRKPEEGSGRSSVSLEIKHLDKLLQFARESFTALFDEREQSAEANAGDTNFFGN